MKNNFSIIGITALVVGVFYIWLLPSTQSGSGPVPVFVQGFDATGSVDPTDVFVSGNYAYLVTDNNSGENPEFYIIDISRPSQPTRVSSLDIKTKVNKVFVMGDYAYLATNAGDREIVTINIANKTAPTVVGGYDAPGNANGLAIFVELRTMIIASSTNIYLGTANNSSGSEFYILNGMNPAKLTLLGSEEIGGAVNDIAVHDGKAFIGTSRGSKEFAMLNVERPTAPLETWAYDVPGVTTAAYGVDYSYNTAYMVTPNNGSKPDFYIFDVSGQTPQLSGSLDLQSNNLAVEALETKAYIVTSGATTPILKIIDISSSTMPTVLSSYYDGVSRGVAVALDPQFIYAASRYDTQELMIFDPLFDVISIKDVNNDKLIKVGCFGDSNTMAYIENSRIIPQWCGYLQEYIHNPMVAMINAGFSRASAVDTSGAVYGAPLYADYFLTPQLETMTLDIAILAYGTNDIAYGVPIDDVVSTYKTLRDKIVSYGVRPFIALTPPNYSNDGIFNTAINELNAALIAAFPPEELIDFYSTMNYPQDYQADGVHLNIQGQRERAQQAYEKLLPSN